MNQKTNGWTEIQTKAHTKKMKRITRKFTSVLTQHQNISSCFSMSSSTAVSIMMDALDRCNDENLSFD